MAIILDAGNIDAVMSESCSLLVHVAPLSMSPSFPEYRCSAQQASMMHPCTTGTRQEAYNLKATLDIGCYSPVLGVPVTKKGLVEVSRWRDTS